MAMQPEDNSKKSNRWCFRSRNVWLQDRESFEDACVLIDGEIITGVHVFSKKPSQQQHHHSTERIPSNHIIHDSHSMNNNLYAQGLYGEYIDYGELFVFPGLIDMNVSLHVGSDWEDIADTTQLFAQGGVTTIALQPLITNDQYLKDELHSIRHRKTRMENISSVDYCFFANLYKNNISALEDIANEPGVAGFKIYLTPPLQNGAGWVESKKDMEEILSAVNAFRGKVYEEQIGQFEAANQRQKEISERSQQQQQQLSPRRRERQMLIQFHSIKSGDKELTITSPLRQRSMSDRCDKDTTLRRTQGDSVLGETQKQHKIAEENADDQFEDITMGEISNCINDNILDLKVCRESSDEDEKEEGNEGDIDKNHISKDQQSVNMENIMNHSSQMNSNSNSRNSPSSHKHQHKNDHNRQDNSISNNNHSLSNVNENNSFKGDHEDDQKNNNDTTNNNATLYKHLLDSSWQQQQSTQSPQLSYSSSTASPSLEQHQQSKRDKILSIYAKATINSTENLQQMLIARAEMKTYNRNEEGDEENEDILEKDHEDNYQDIQSSSSSSSSDSSQIVSEEDNEESKDSSEQEDQFEDEKKAFIKRIQTTTRERIKSCVDPKRPNKIAANNYHIYSPQPKKLGVEQILANFRKESQESQDDQQQPSPLFLHSNGKGAESIIEKNLQDLKMLEDVHQNQNENVEENNYNNNNNNKVIRIQRVQTEDEDGKTNITNNTVRDTERVKEESDKITDLQKIDENVDSDDDCEDDTTANQSMQSRISTMHKGSYQEFSQYYSAKNSVSYSDYNTSDAKILLLSNEKNNHHNRNHENTITSSHAFEGIIDGSANSKQIHEIHHREFEMNKKSTFNTTTKDESQDNKNSKEDLDMKEEKKSELSVEQQNIEQKVEQEEKVKEQSQFHGESQIESQQQELIPFSQDKAYEMVFESDNNKPTVSRRSNYQQKQEEKEEEQQDIQPIAPRSYCKLSIDEYLLQQQSTSTAEKDQQETMVQSSIVISSRQPIGIIGRQRLLEKRRSMNLIVKVDQSRSYSKYTAFSHMQQKISNNQLNNDNTQTTENNICNACPQQDVFMQKSTGLILEEPKNDLDNENNNNQNNVCSDLNFDDAADHLRTNNKQYSNNQQSLTPESNEDTPKIQKNRKASTDFNITYLSESKQTKQKLKYKTPCSPIQDVFPSSEAIILEDATSNKEFKLDNQKTLVNTQDNTININDHDKEPSNKDKICSEVGLLNSNSSIQQTPMIGKKTPLQQHQKSPQSQSKLSQQRSFVSEQNLPKSQSKFKQDYLTFLAFRPPYWEYFGISMIRDSLKKSMDSSKKTIKLKLIFSNIGNCNSMYRITALKEELRGSVQVYSETTAAHLFFSANRIKNGVTIFKCEPPIGTKENKEFLINASKLNMVDVVSSYHFPVDTAYKCIADGDFRKAFSGICTAGCTLQATWTALYMSYKHSQTNSLRPIIPDSQSPEVDSLKKTHALLKFIANMLAYKPAKILNISSTKGSIAKGKQADFVIWDPFAQPQRIKIPNDYKFKEVHIFDKKKVYGQVHFTILRGEVIFDAGKHIFHQHKGQLVRSQFQQ